MILSTQMKIGSKEYSIGIIRLTNQVRTSNRRRRRWGRGRCRTPRAPAPTDARSTRTENKMDHCLKCIYRVTIQVDSNPLLIPEQIAQWIKRIEHRNGTEGAMVRTSLGSLLRPLLYFLCSILLIHRVHGAIHIWYLIYNGWGGIQKNR